MNELKDEYILQYSDQLNLKEFEELATDLDLEVVPIPDDGGITGVVVDESGDPVDGATVKIFDLNFNPVKHTMTDEEGNYSITGIKEGSYQVYAIKDGYKLSNKFRTSIKSTLVTIPNIPIAKFTENNNGTLYGKVFTRGNTPLSRVKLTLLDEDGITKVADTLSADDGEYLFHSVDAGNYILTAIAEDYVLKTPIEVTINVKVAEKENLYLDKVLNNKKGTINGCVKDKLTGVPVENAFVGLYLLDEENEEFLVAGTKTDREGKYFFGCVPEGKYIVKAKATNNQ